MKNNSIIIKTEILFLIMLTLLLVANEPAVIAVASPLAMESSDKCLPANLEIRQKIIVEIPAPDSGLIYIGEFNAAAYCSCDKCCGEGRRKLTSSGTPPKANHTIAANLDRFQLGDTLVINDVTYTVEDKAGQADGTWINIYFNDHEKALDYGIQTVEVYQIPAKQPGNQENILGTFEVTGYCGCELCCGELHGERLTYQETTPKSSHTIAADPDVIPMGTLIELDGVIYTVEDIGSAIKGNRLDIFFDTHDEAIVYGRKSKTVYLAN